MNAPPPYQPPPPPYAPGPSGPQPYAPQGPPGPPPKKKVSGCLIALAIVGGLILLGGLVTGIVVYRFVKSEDGQKVVTAIASGASMMAEASKAPGTKELRALGCNMATVLSAEQLQAYAQAVSDGGSPEPAEEGAPMLVNCTASWGARGPTCNDVATTYVGAVGGKAAANFLVTVTETPKGTACQGLYTPTAKLISDHPATE